MKLYISTSLVKGEENYQWYKYKGKKPYAVSRRGGDVHIGAGDVFGIRGSANGKSIRLVLRGQLTKVFTITDTDVGALTKNSSPTK